MAANKQTASGGRCYGSSSSPRDCNDAPLVMPVYRGPLCQRILGRNSGLISAPPAGVTTANIGDNSAETDAASTLDAPQQLQLPSDENRHVNSDEASSSLDSAADSGAPVKKQRLKLLNLFKEVETWEELVIPRKPEPPAPAPIAHATVGALGGIPVSSALLSSGNAAAVGLPQGSMMMATMADEYHQPQQFQQAAAHLHSAGGAFMPRHFAATPGAVGPGGMLMSPPPPGSAAASHQQMRLQMYEMMQQQGRAGPAGQQAGFMAGPYQGLGGGGPPQTMGDLRGFAAATRAGHPLTQQHPSIRNPFPPGAPMPPGMLEAMAASSGGAGGMLMSSPQAGGSGIQQQPRFTLPGGNATGGGPLANMVSHHATGLPVASTALASACQSPGGGGVKSPPLTPSLHQQASRAAGLPPLPLRSPGGAPAPANNSNTSTTTKGGRTSSTTSDTFGDLDTLAQLGQAIAEQAGGPSSTDPGAGGGNNSAFNTPTADGPAPNSASFFRMAAPGSSGASGGGQQQMANAAGSAAGMISAGHHNSSSGSQPTTPCMPAPILNERKSSIDNVIDNVVMSINAHSTASSAAAPTQGGAQQTLQRPLGSATPQQQYMTTEMSCSVGGQPSTPVNGPGGGLPPGTPSTPASSATPGSGQHQLVSGAAHPEASPISTPVSAVIPGGQDGGPPSNSSSAAQGALAHMLQQRQAKSLDYDILSYAEKDRRGVGGAGGGGGMDVFDFETSEPTEAGKMGAPPHHHHRSYSIPGSAGLPPDCVVGNSLVSTPTDVSGCQQTLRGAADLSSGNLQAAAMSLLGGPPSAASSATQQQLQHHQMSTPQLTPAPPRARGQRARKPRGRSPINADRGGGAAGAAGPLPASGRGSRGGRVRGGGRGGRGSRGSAAAAAAAAALQQQQQQASLINSNSGAASGPGDEAQQKMHQAQLRMASLQQLVASGGAQQFPFNTASSSSSAEEQQQMVAAAVSSQGGLSAMIAGCISPTVAMARVGAPPSAVGSTDALAQTPTQQQYNPASASSSTLPAHSSSILKSIAAMTSSVGGAGGRADAGMTPPGSVTPTNLQQFQLAAGGLPGSFSANTAASLTPIVLPSSASKDGAVAGPKTSSGLLEAVLSARTSEPGAMLSSFAAGSGGSKCPTPVLQATTPSSAGAGIVQQQQVLCGTSGTPDRVLSSNASASTPSHQTTGGGTGASLDASCDSSEESVSSVGVGRDPTAAVSASGGVEYASWESGTVGSGGRRSVNGLELQGGVDALAQLQAGADLIGGLGTTEAEIDKKFREVMLEEDQRSAAAAMAHQRHQQPSSKVSVSRAGAVSLGAATNLSAAEVPRNLFENLQFSGSGLDPFTQLQYSSSGGGGFSATTAAAAAAMLQASNRVTPTARGKPVMLNRRSGGLTAVIEKLVGKQHAGGGSFPSSQEELAAVAAGLAAEADGGPIGLGFEDALDSTASISLQQRLEQLAAADGAGGVDVVGASLGIRPDRQHVSSAATPVSSHPLLLRELKSPSQPPATASSISPTACFGVSAARSAPSTAASSLSSSVASSASSSKPNATSTEGRSSDLKMVIKLPNANKPARVKTKLSSGGGTSSRDEQHGSGSSGTRGLDVVTKAKIRKGSSTKSASGGSGSSLKKQRIAALPHELLGTQQPPGVVPSATGGPLGILTPGGADLAASQASEMMEQLQTAHREAACGAATPVTTKKRKTSFCDVKKASKMKKIDQRALSADPQSAPLAQTGSVSLASGIVAPSGGIQSDSKMKASFAETKQQLVLSLPKIPKVSLDQRSGVAVACGTAPKQAAAINVATTPATVGDNNAAAFIKSYGSSTATAASVGMTAGVPPGGGAISSAEFLKGVTGCHPGLKNFKIPKIDESAKLTPPASSSTSSANEGNNSISGLAGKDWGRSANAEAGSNNGSTRITEGLFKSDTAGVSTGAGLPFPAPPLSTIEQKSATATTPFLQENTPTTPRGFNSAPTTASSSSLRNLHMADSGVSGQMDESATSSGSNSPRGAARNKPPLLTSPTTVQGGNDATRQGEQSANISNSSAMTSTSLPQLLAASAAPSRLWRAQAGGVGGLMGMASAFGATAGATVAGGGGIAGRLLTMSGGTAPPPAALFGTRVAGSAGGQDYPMAHSGLLRGAAPRQAIGSGHVLAGGGRSGPGPRGLFPTPPMAHLSAARLSSLAAASGHPNPLLFSGPAGLRNRGPSIVTVDSTQRTASATVPASPEEDQLVIDDSIEPASTATVDSDATAPEGVGGGCQPGQLSSEQMAALPGESAAPVAPPPQDAPLSLTTRLSASSQHSGSSFESPAKIDDGLMDEALGISE